MSPTERDPVTVSDVVRRAVEVCDPAGASDALSELLALYEDRDEPVTAVADVERDLSEAAGSIEVDAQPDLAMAVAVATYLAHRRAELDSDRDDVLRLAVRAEFADGTPPAVADWLEREGIRV